MGEHMSPERILETGFGFWPAKVLLTAVELGVFTELDEGPKTAAELREALDLHSRSVRDFLDALVALGFLHRDGEAYANTAEAGQFLVRGSPAYIGGLLEMANARLYPFWGDLTEGLRTGEPQNELKRGGEDFFARLYEDPERLRDFVRAMTGLSYGAHRAIAEKFPWTEYGTLADIGTAEGGLPAEVAKSHPHVTGLGCDLPPVEPHFRGHLKRQGVLDRFAFHPLDFWQEELPAADVLAFGHILHDWSTAGKLELLAKAHRALHDGGAILVYESVIDNERQRNHFGLLMSLNMLIETREGFDYTGAECEAWMRQVGFRGTRTEHLAGPDSMVVGFKNRA